MALWQVLSCFSRCYYDATRTEAAMLLTLLYQSPFLTTSLDQTEDSISRTSYHTQIKPKIEATMRPTTFLSILASAVLTIALPNHIKDHHAIDILVETKPIETRQGQCLPDSCRPIIEKCAPKNCSDLERPAWFVPSERYGMIYVLSNTLQLRCHH